VAATFAAVCAVNVVRALRARVVPTFAAVCAVNVARDLRARVVPTFAAVCAVNVVRGRFGARPPDVNRAPHVHHHLPYPAAVRRGLPPVPSDAHATMRVMFTARLVCPDADCAEELIAEAETVAELDALACQCGCALEIVGWPDWADDDVAEAIILHLHRRRQPPARRAA
jgi:hypothetical protein